jgi:two-component sensor histidine kinase/tetratricopeptide (TPR) repeat protein
MTLLKKGFLLFLNIGVLLNSGYPLSISYYQNPDTLFKKAYDCPDPLTGIRLAKQAWLRAKQVNNKIIIIKSLNVIAEYYGDLRSYDSSRVYALNALSTSDRYHIDSLKGNSWLYLGMADYKTGSFQLSVDKYKKAVPVFIAAHKLPGLATAYLNIGVSEDKLSQYSEAINYFIRSSAIFESLKNDQYLSYDLNSIANCFVELNNYPKALEYNKKALVIRKKLKEKELVAESLNNIGFVFEKNKQPDSAIYYLSKCLAIRQHEKDSTSLVLTLQDLGASVKMKGDLKMAESYVLRSERIAAHYDMKEDIARGNSDLAEIYIQQKKYNQALVAINITIATARQLNIPELLMEAYSIKYNLYQQSGDYKNALYYSNKKSDLKDSLFSVAKNKTIDELEIKYQTSQKEKDIIALHLQNNLQQKIVKQQRLSITVLVVAAILLLLLFIIAYNSFRVKNRANLRIQTLMRDLHHRVKNNLQILSGLFTMQIENLSDEGTKNALRENEARLTSMNLIHNKLYLDNTTTKIEMNEYLTNLLNHIKDSFGGQKQSAIDLRIEVSNIMLEADKAVAIGLIANELATNAFKYAFTDKGGEIHLALELIEKSKLLLTLSDNGIGLKAENKDKAPSFGLKLVNLMARQLNSTLIVKNNHGVSYQLEISI